MKNDSSSISSLTSDSLSGHLLVATPQMTDPRFKRAVIFICQHDTEAAMGLVINKPNTDLSFKKLAEHLNLDQSCLDSVSASMESLGRHIALFGKAQNKDELIRSIEAVSIDSLSTLTAQIIAGRPAMAAVGPVSAVMNATDLSDLFAS